MVRFALAFILLLPAVGSAQQPQAVTFTRRAPAVGDQAEQTVEVDFRLKSTTRSGAEVLDESQAHLRRDHKRLMTTTQLGPHGPAGATVEYLQAQRSVNGAAAAEEPVAGKTYKCVRHDEQLVVTTPEGLLPPMAEFEIVSRNMETLGVENPLVKFFTGRTVNVGQRIDLPIELAEELLGFEDKFAAAKRFSMTLTETRMVDGRLCAVFKTEIEAGGSGGGQMGLLVAGPMVMQVQGCRAVSAELTGPIGMSDSKSAGPGVSYQVTGMGNMRVAIKTRYRDASAR